MLPELSDRILSRSLAEICTFTLGGMARCLKVRLRSRPESLGWVRKGA